MSLVFGYRKVLLSMAQKEICRFYNFISYTLVSMKDLPREIFCYFYVYLKKTNYNTNEDHSPEQFMSDKLDKKK